jgi:hypothetical protein
VWAGLVLKRRTGSALASSRTARHRFTPPQGDEALIKAAKGGRHGHRDAAGVMHTPRGRAASDFTARIP